MRSLFLLYLVFFAFRSLGVALSFDMGRNLLARWKRNAAKVCESMLDYVSRLVIG